MTTSASLPVLRPGERVQVRFGTPAPVSAGRELVRWLDSQAVNAARAAAMIRPFGRDEFGTDAASPGPAHLAAVNRMIRSLRRLLVAAARTQADASRAAAASPSREAFDDTARAKEAGTLAVAAIEKVWQFYRDIFEQRTTRFAPRLLACDRIALDCYQYVWGGLGRARPIPSPAPFSYMESGSGPATFRREVRLTRLGRLPNPFPLVKLPYHRLVAPWTLGAVPHEVGHNLQADLGLWQAIPRRFAGLLRRDGIPPEVVRIWVRWHKEIFADLVGVLLIGPAFVHSLMDVVGKSPAAVVQFSPTAVHPVPFLRTLLDLELLARTGFGPEAAALRRAWLSLYPPARARARIPKELLDTFPKAAKRVVDIVAFTPFPQLGDRTLSEVVSFRRQDLAMAEEAAERLARGEDPGIVPERFLIAAARIALQRRHAPPARIARNFFEALGRR